MSEQGKADIVVAMPASATDFVKAIRELFGLVGDVVKGGKWVIDIYSDHQKKHAASNLETLRFTKTGTRPHLERIIAGKHTSADIEAIGRQMAETALEVEIAITRLDKYRDVVRVTFGMQASVRLEEMLSRKLAVRYWLTNLADHAGRPDADPEEVRRTAKEALAAIEKLNDEFCQLHDLILLIDKERK